MTLFFRLLDISPSEKTESLRTLVSDYNASRVADNRVFELQAESLSELVGTPFAYWLPDAVRSWLGRQVHFEDDAQGRVVRQGLATTDDFRFLRAWWEVNPDRIGVSWFSFAKGGRFSPYYADLPLVIEWSNDGAVLKAKIVAEYGNAGKRIYNECHYFKPGITWPLRASRFAPHILPAGSIFSVRGYSAFTPAQELLPTLGIFNGRCFDFIFKTFLGRSGHPEFIVGVLQRLPWMPPRDDLQSRVTELTSRAWKLMRQIDALGEASHAFLLPPGVLERVTQSDAESPWAEIQRIQREIDDLSFANYRMDDAVRERLEAVLGRSKPKDGLANDDDDEDTDEVDDDGAAVIDDAALAVYSWLVGVAFGRFDARLATGERGVPPEPEPFDPLPPRSPGMWPADEARPLQTPDILVDDLGHPRDIVSAVSTNAEPAQVALATAADGLRRWLAREFFPLHIQMYSRSRRRAPIYWQLATPSARYSVWLYIHAFSSDTMFRTQNEYVGPKLRLEEQRLAYLRDEAGVRATAAQRKAIVDQEESVEELHAFLAEVRLVAPLWNPDLDDGVIINFAPLWRLGVHSLASRTRRGA